MSNRRTLGRGLNSLIPANNQNEEKISYEPSNAEHQEVQAEIQPQAIENRLDTDKVEKLQLSQIKAREGQPRKTFDDEALEELSQSIKEYGLLNPIVVTKKEQHYEILAGERRYRATEKLGYKEIDVIVREYSEKDVEVLSLVENVQREDLKALEEANAYKSLAENYGMTQEQIAKTMGKSRSYIANTMRLLNLNDDEKEALNESKISPSQARTLLSITDEELRSKTLDDFINGLTNIRNVEKKTKKNSSKQETNQGPNIDDILVEDLEEKFMDRLGSKVDINKSGSTFKVTIDCYSIEDIESLYERLVNEA